LEARRNHRYGLPSEPRAAVRAAVVAAKNALNIIIAYFQKQQADSKFRLKAAGAHWHSENITGPIENCPLCDISMKDDPALQEELEALRSAGEAATRGFEDNINAIMASLVEAMPQSLRRLLDDALTSRPCADVKNDYRRMWKLSATPSISRDSKH
jgi:hypothetical protein